MGMGAGAGAPTAMRTLLLLWLALAGACAWLRCPDGQPCPATPVLPASSAAACQDGSPCPTGASCPLPEGVPCAGGRHCCPHGSRCSADGKSCITSPAPRAIPCPDGQSECPDDATCCMTASGTWGCCPMPQASCCADKVHCCPHTTICDLAHGRCLSPTGDGDIPLGTSFPAWKRQPPAPVVSHEVLCPDGHSACPDGATCCQLPSAQYGCCPLQNAVCCSDGQHCCPQGTVCDLERSTCTSERSLASLPKARDVKCDEETSCPDGYTCCRLSSGAWGCCPLEEAICCPDHIHCCPQGHTCDPVTGRCLQEGGGHLPWVQKTPALAREKDVQCDEETSCPDGNTCCRLSLGTWGCCPLEQAVCCPDHIHCCPQGHTCDPVAGRCLQEGGGHLPWVQKTPALAREKDVQCDEETSCPDGYTCCQLSSGAWGCCPLEEAVCCPDHIHCCPQGHTCDPVTGRCLQEGGGHLPWVQKTPALAREKDVQCDEETSCPDGNTCCRLSLGTWGCCPLEQAVCCGDHQHCCPQGYTCNMATQSCEKLLAPTPLLRAPTSPLRVPAPPRRAHPPTSPAASRRYRARCPGALRCCPLLPQRAAVLPEPGGLLGVLPLQPGLLLLRWPSLLPWGVPLHWGGLGVQPPALGPARAPQGAALMALGTL
ncbi:LOW QUALITY PROTEIN: progranulin [Morphnus guianensis]